MTARELTRVVARGALGGVVLLTAETLWAVLQPAPRFPDHDASGVEGPPDGVPLRLVVVGDSTTTGPGVDHPDEIWIRQLARRLDGYRVEVRSFAVSGAKLEDVIRDQLDAAIEAAGDITFVSAGANDALRGTPLTRVEENLDTILTRLQPASRHVVVCGVGDLGTIPRFLPPLDLIMRARGKAVDEVAERVARAHGAVKIDMWGLTTHAFRTDPEVFSPDRFHPSAKGHRVWADAAFVTVAPLLQ
jgi:lysophospholipase L1-like esterase